MTVASPQVPLSMDSSSKNEWVAKVSSSSRSSNPGPNPGSSTFLLVILPSELPEKDKPT